MSNTTIDSGIPIPDDAKTGSRAKYPYAKMEVGQSVYFDGQNTQSNCVTAAYIHGMKHNKKFSARKDASGVRVWRIK